MYTTAEMYMFCKILWLKFSHNDIRRIASVEYSENNTMEWITWGGATSTSSSTSGLLGSYATAAAMTHNNNERTKHHCNQFREHRSKIWRYESQHSLSGITCLYVCKRKRVGESRDINSTNHHHSVASRNKFANMNGNPYHSKLSVGCAKQLIPYHPLTQSNKGLKLVLNFLTFASDCLPFCWVRHRAGQLSPPLYVIQAPLLNKNEPSNVAPLEMITHKQREREGLKVWADESQAPQSTALSSEIHTVMCFCGMT